MDQAHAAAAGLAKYVVTPEPDAQAANGIITTRRIGGNDSDLGRALLCPEHEYRLYVDELRQISGAADDMAPVRLVSQQPDLTVVRYITETVVPSLLLETSRRWLQG